MISLLCSPKKSAATKGSLSTFARRKHSPQKLIDFAFEDVPCPAPDTLSEDPVAIPRIKLGHESARHVSEFVEATAPPLLVVVSQLCGREQLVRKADLGGLPARPELGLLVRG